MARSRRAKMTTMTHNSGTWPSPISLFLVENSEKAEWRGRLRSNRRERSERNRAMMSFLYFQEKLAKAMFPSCGSWWSFLLVLSVPSSEYPCLATTSTGAFAPLHVFLLAVASKFSEAQAQRSTSRRLAPPVRGSSRAEGPFFEHVLASLQRRIVFAANASRGC